MRIKLFLLSLASFGLLASSAQAVPVFYGEVFTSRALGNVHAELTALAPPASPIDILSSVDVDVLGSGLGSGYVVGGSPIHLTHTFAPDGYSVNSITSAVLSVSVVDDQLFDSRETASITVDGNPFASGGAMFNIFNGSVVGLITASGDSFDVWIAATRGDFRVLWSGIGVVFDGTPVGTAPPHAPEPTAALLFAAGIALVARRRLA